MHPLSCLPVIEQVDVLNKQKTYALHFFESLSLSLSYKFFNLNMYLENF